jgi:glutathione S-transferase
MRTLYHYPLCPYSRQIRLILKEYNQSFNLIKEDYWTMRPEFLSALSPSGEVPVLIEQNNLVISDIYSILEYLIDECADERFVPKSDRVKMAEFRRLVSWYNKKFYREVTKHMLDEKLIRIMQRNAFPKPEIIRAARNNLHHHMQYINTLLSNKDFIFSEYFTLIDLIVASHLSIIDYFNEIQWDNYFQIKEWYSLIKSRPSFKAILNDRIPGFNPPKHYDELDY